MTARLNPPERAFRTDIEGLRAVAIGGVILFHAAVPTFTGGYVGVDVFFVISGFLITGLLMRDLTSFGTVRLKAFYARRAKRLLPAAAVVIVATAVLAPLFAPVLAVYKACLDLLAALFYVGNWRFIREGNDYLAGTSDHNVALHFWSLAVEEQFYLIWPALIIAAAALARRRGIPVRRAVAVTIAVLSAISFGLAVWLTWADPAQAYMATHTRGWQFGLGALTAILATSLPQHRWTALLAPLGLLAIGWSFVAFDSATPYPGWAAVVPTVGTALVVGFPRSPANGLLSHPLMRWVGRWSYPWYLWHWPILVLVEDRFGHIAWPIRLALMALAFGLAGLTHVAVEKPVMRATMPTRAVASAASIGLISSVVACMAILMVGTQSARALGSGETTVTAVQFEDVFGKETGANSGPVQPSPLTAKADIPRPASCLLDRTSVQPSCTFGPRGARRMVLFGDSKANQWASAVRTIAAQRGWQLTVLTQAGCPAPDFIPRDKTRVSQKFCITWRHEQIAHIVAMKPAVVVMSAADYGRSNNETMEAWAKTLGELHKSGAKLVYLRDTPYPPEDIPECISSSMNDWRSCSFHRSKKVDPAVTGALQGTLPNLTVIDLNGYLCSQQTCPAVRNGIMLYRDSSHLSDTAVKALTPALSREFKDDDL